MPDTKHPSDIPRMVPDRDDIRSRQQQSKRQPDAVKAKPAGVTSHEVKQTSPTPWVLIVFLLVISGAVGYLALQQYSTQQMIAVYEERLSIADERIVTLEQALTQTDESVAMNETALNAQFKAIKTESDLQMSEIRKLWDVANKRNREWIEANQESIKKVNETIATLSAQSTTVATQLTATESSLSAMRAQLETDSGAISRLSTQASEQTQTLSRLTTSLNAIETQLAGVPIAAIQEQIISLTLSQENLLAEQGELTDNDVAKQRQLAEMQQAINAIDASRLEFNRRLVALNAQLDDVNARLTNIAGPGQ